MQVNAGEFNKRIEILKYGKADNKGFNRELENVCKRWAKFTRYSAAKKNEINSSGTTLHEIECKFLIRYTKTAIDTDMLIKYHDEYYHIVDLNDIEDKHRYIEIYCKKGEL